MPVTCLPFYLISEFLWLSIQRSNFNVILIHAPRLCTCEGVLIPLS